MNVLRVSHTLTAPILSSNPSQLTHEMTWNGIEYETYPARKLLIASGVSQHHSLVRKEQSEDLILALSFRGAVKQLEDFASTKIYQGRRIVCFICNHVQEIL